MEEIKIKTIPYYDTWPIRNKVMWPEKPLDYVKLENDPHGVHFGLFVRGELLSIVSVFVSDEDAQFRKFATLTEGQGKGYGTKLLTHTFAELKKKDCKKIWCNARTNKTYYYQRFGMRETDNRFTKGRINFVVMEKCL